MKFSESGNLKLFFFLFHKRARAIGKYIFARHVVIVSLSFFNLADYFPLLAQLCREPQSLWRVALVTRRGKWVKRRLNSFLHAIVFVAQNCMVFVGKINGEMDKIKIRKLSTLFLINYPFFRIKNFAFLMIEFFSPQLFRSLWKKWR